MFLARGANLIDFSAGRLATQRLLSLKFDALLRGRDHQDFQNTTIQPTTSKDVLFESCLRSRPFCLEY